VLFVAGTATASSPTPTQTSSSSPTPTPNPTSSSAGTPTPTPTPTGDPDPAPTGIAAQPSIGAGWTLTPSQVGLTPLGLRCDALPEYVQQGNSVPAGTVIDEKRITGWLDLSAGNITIKRSCIQPKPGAVGAGTTALTTWSSKHELQGPVTIEDSEYDGSLLSAYDQAHIGLFTGVANFYRNYIHNSGSGLGTYGSEEKTGSDVVIQNNYVDRLTAYGDPTTSGNHQSAYSVRDFDTSTNPDRQLLVKDNYLDCDGANATGALFIQANGGNIRNVTVQGNLLAGNGYQLYLDYQPGRFAGVGYSNIWALDNRMTDTGWGAVFVRDGGPGFAQWTGNYVYDAADALGEGKLIPDPS